MHLLEKTTAHLQPSCKPRTSPFYAHNTLSCTHQLHTPLDVNNTIVCFISSFGNLFAFPWRLEHVCVDLADNTKLAVSPGNALKIFAVTLNISMGIVLMGTISAHSKAFADWLTSAGTQSKGVYCMVRKSFLHVAAILFFFYLVTLRWWNLINCLDHERECAVIRSVLQKRSARVDT